MIRKFLFLLFTSVLLLNFQCDSSTEEPSSTTGKIKINFLLTYDGVPLYMDKAVPYMNNLNLKFQRVSLYSQLYNDKNPLSSNFLVNFSNIYDEKSAKNGVIQELTVDAGTYQKVNLGIGVNSSDNKKRPKDFPSSNPLSEPGDYWDSWSSYIFTKTEGKYDTDLNGKFSESFSYHTGTDEMYRMVAFPNQITVNKDATTEITATIDVKKILSGKGGDVDPNVEKSSHSLSNKNLAIKIMNNYSEAFSIK